MSTTSTFAVGQLEGTRRGQRGRGTRLLCGLDAPGVFSLKREGEET